MSGKKHQAPKQPFSLKKSLSSLLAIAIGLLVGGGIGVFLGAYSSHAAGDNDALGFLYIAGGMAMLYLAFMLQVILHEGGHMVCGLLTGYEFVSFNVFGLIWTRGRDGKLHLGRMQIAGAGGQCLMAPPPYDGGRFRYTLYNMGGVIANLAASAVCFLLAVPARNVPVLFIFLIEMGLVGVISAALNGLPLPVASLQNDGKNQLCIRRDDCARRAFWVQMTVAAEISRGTRLKNIPEELFRPFPEEAMDNPIVTAVAVLHANRLMDALDFDGAEAAIRALLAREHGLVGLHRLALACDGATCELIAGRPADLTDLIFTKENQQLMKAMKHHPTIIRTCYAATLLRDRNPEKATVILKHFEEAAGKHPYPQEIAGERELLLAVQNAALNGGITV